MKIIIANSIGTNGTSLPKDMIELAMPFEKACEQVGNNHLPEIELIRLTATGEKKFDFAVDLKSFGGNVNNLKFVGKKTKIELEKRTVNGDFPGENESGFSESVVLSQYASTKSKVEGNLFFSYVDDTYEMDANNFNELKLYENIDSVRAQIKTAFCENKKIKSVYILYNPSASSNDAAKQPTEIATVINEIGDIKISPEIRRSKVDNYFDQYFSPEADVKELGKNGSLVGIISAREYLRKISQYKTIDRIEIVKALQNPDGKYWELQVFEHHIE